MKRKGCTGGTDKNEAITLYCSQGVFYYQTELGLDFTFNLGFHTQLRSQLITELFGNFFL